CFSPFSLNDWPLQKSRRTPSLSLLYPTTGFPSRNHTGCACHTLFSASGSARSISSARRRQIARSAGAWAELYAFVSGCIRSPQGGVGRRASPSGSGSRPSREEPGGGQRVYLGALDQLLHGHELLRAVG